MPPTTESIRRQGTRAAFSDNCTCSGDRHLVSRPRRPNELPRLPSIRCPLRLVSLATPAERIKESSSIDYALRDALRETMSAYVMSELRDVEDFKATLSFAANGQIIFATAHNAFLVDTVRKLVFFSSTPGNIGSCRRTHRQVHPLVHIRFDLPHNFQPNRLLTAGLHKWEEIRPHAAKATATRSSSWAAWIEASKRIARRATIASRRLL